MLTTIFLDTSFIVAVINRRDQYHGRAMEHLDRYEVRPKLVTDAVLLEVGNMLAKSHRQASVEIIEDFLSSDDVEVVHLDKNLFRRAFTLFKQYQDKAWGLVDCISFVVMREAGVHQALAFDQHFVQAGFETL